jgi:ATP-dependent Clp protease ATP-binding subunit ClpA
MQQQLAWYQQQHKQVQQQQYQEAVVKAETDYRERLVEEGYMPDQARKLASEARGQAEYQLQQQQQYEQQLQVSQGRHNAARHYAAHYKLGISDLGELEKLPDPASMEREAKRIAEIRDLRSKYEQVARGRVQPQSFDSGVSSAGASRSRERILDDYNEGRVNLTADQYHRLMSNN